VLNNVKSQTNYHILSVIGPIMGLHLFSQDVSTTVYSDVDAHIQRLSNKGHLQHLKM